MNFKKLAALALAGTFAFGMAATTASVEAAQKKEPPKIEQPAPNFHKDKQDAESRVDQKHADLKQKENKEPKQKEQKNQPAPKQKEQRHQQPAPVAEHK